MIFLPYWCSYMSLYLSVYLSVCPCVCSVCPAPGRRLINNPVYRSGTDLGEPCRSCTTLDKENPWTSGRTLNMMESPGHLGEPQTWRNALDIRENLALDMMESLRMERPKQLVDPWTAGRTLNTIENPGHLGEPWISGRTLANWEIPRHEGEIWTSGRTLGIWKNKYKIVCNTARKTTLLLLRLTSFSVKKAADWSSESRLAQPCRRLLMLIAVWSQIVPFSLASTRRSTVGLHAKTAHVRYPSTTPGWSQP